MIFIITIRGDYDFSHQPIISLGQVDGKSLFFHLLFIVCLYTYMHKMCYNYTVKNIWLLAFTNKIYICKTGAVI